MQRLVEKDNMIIFPCKVWYVIVKIFLLAKTFFNQNSDQWHWITVVVLFKEKW